MRVQFAVVFSVFVALGIPQADARMAMSVEPGGSLITRIASTCTECTSGLTVTGMCQQAGASTGPCPHEMPRMAKPIRNVKDCPPGRAVMICDHKSLSNIRCAWKCKPDEKKN